jgi:hypothetical protein
VSKHLAHVLRSLWLAHDEAAYVEKCSELWPCELSHHLSSRRGLDRELGLAHVAGELPLVAFVERRVCGLRDEHASLPLSQARQVAPLLPAAALAR